MDGYAERPEQDRENEMGVLEVHIYIASTHTIISWAPIH